jgi:hypothetical protein
MSERTYDTSVVDAIGEAIAAIDNHIKVIADTNRVRANYVAATENLSNIVIAELSKARVWSKIEKTLSKSTNR